LQTEFLHFFGVLNDQEGFDRVLFRVTTEEIEMLTLGKTRSGCVLSS
jgi:hypothetical protein